MQRSQAYGIHIILPFLFTILAACELVVAAPPPDFASEVQPIFAKHCYACHGPKEEEGGLRLDDRARAMEGGVSGPVIVPGKASESYLWQFVTGRNEDRIVMPPKGKGERLTEDQCETIRRWIDAGAIWPDNGGTKAVSVRRRVGKL